MRDFAAFALFWPTMISGPIKRYQQFIPALHEGIKSQTAVDAMHGLMRVAVGFAKKWAADNLTGWIDFYEPQLAFHTLGLRWMFLFAISARILLDFSGYSDMAIGYARLMGIRVPENFNWPYLARSPVEFWQRWHMSLSFWIRDYVYIPLGGNRLRKSAPDRQCACGDDHLWPVARSRMEFCNMGTLSWSGPGGDRRPPTSVSEH